jgi:hypothetical protein
MNNAEYKDKELRDFRASTGKYYTIKEFSAWLEHTDIAEQIRWIENGTYGCGACLALQAVLQLVKRSTRLNKKANVGQIILHAFYGSRFRYWRKLSATAQNKFDSAVSEWLGKEHDFAIEL